MPKAVNDAKAGKIEYRLDKSNIIHCPIGKASFGPEKLMENLDTLMEAIVKAKPAATKGTYIKSCLVASTMGPGVKFSASKYGTEAVKLSHFSTLTDRTVCANILNAVCHQRQQVSRKGCNGI